MRSSIQKFCLDDYLPKALNYDIGLLETSDEEKGNKVSNISSNHSFCSDEFSYETKDKSSYITNCNYIIKFLVSLIDEMLANIHSTKTSDISTSLRKKNEIKLSEFLRCQKGSRIYQRKLKKATCEDIDEILKNLDGHLANLLTNVYGNYFCQKLYTVCNINQKIYFLENVKYILILDQRKYFKNR